MKILLVQPNLHRSSTGYIEGAPVPAPAHGIMYVSSYLKEKGFDVTTLNLNHYPTKKLDDILQKNRFDAVCTGGMFTYMTKFTEIITLARQYNKNVKTILGGPVASAHPEFAMEALNPDYLVLGEGEKTCADLLTALSNNYDIKEVLGIAFKNNGQVVQTKPNVPIEDLDSLPFPDYEGFEFEKFVDLPQHRPLSYVAYLLENRRSGSVIGGRDCSGKCTFCFRITGGKFRVRSVDNVISEIKYLINQYGINNLGISDDLFSLHKQRIYEFCSKIKSTGLMWTCQLRVNKIDEDLLMTMKDAGCVLVSYGFESANETVLKSMKKGITIKQIENALELTKKAKMTLQANFIFGDPAETLETAKETLNFAKRYRSFSLGLLPVKPYPGSPLYHDLIKKGVIKNLYHFWITSCFDKDMRVINMTSLNYAEYKLLQARVYLERLRKCYFNTILANKLSQSKYKVSMFCTNCYKKIEDLILDGPSLIACPHCLMRSYLDPIDLICRRELLRRPIKLLRKFIIFTAEFSLGNKWIGLKTYRGWNFIFARILKYWT